MSPNRAIKTLILGLLFLAGIEAAEVPKFANYPASRVFKGKPAMPRFRRDDNQLSHFQDQVAFDREHGPNFAGHYTLAIWSCGSGCSGAVVVDSVTGKIYRKMPFNKLVLPSLDMQLEPYSFRANSRLLIVAGFFDFEPWEKNAECSRRYYEWTGSSFKLLRKVRLSCTPQP